MELNVLSSALDSRDLNIFRIDRICLLINKFYPQIL